MGLFDKFVVRLINKGDEDEVQSELHDHSEKVQDAAVSSESEEDSVPAAPDHAEDEVTANAAPKKSSAVSNAEVHESFSSAPSEVNASDMKKTLLIVNDDEQYNRTLEKILGSSYHLMWASDNEEALSLIWDNAQDISVVLVDVSTADRSGLDFIRTVKNESALNIPVIAITSDEDSLIKALGTGAADHIGKPLPDALVVRARIDRCAELAESRNIINATEYDSLTALYNDDYFRYYVDQFDRHYPDVAMDAIIAAIVNFNMIVKHYGKRFGDEVLQAVGQSVKQITFEMGGYSCRSGNDFLINCPHTDSYKEIIDDISESVERVTSVAGKVRMAIGVYPEADKSVSIDRRFERAKIAVQSVMDTYTGRVGVYSTQMHDEAVFKEQILGEFINSLKNDRFKIYYQPKFDIRGDKPVLYSAEALVRWDHPELGMLSPGKFIGLLEENGLITQLDRYVWSRAAAQIRRWKNEFGYSVPVSVNISNIDMLLPLLKDIFKEILQKYQLTNDDIILEITQSAYDTDSALLISAAQELRGMGLGMRIEVGNVGAGYSSIGMLSRMPVDVLKIDMEFVHNSLGDNKDLSMVELIIDIADYLNVPVLAEGVETLDQYLLLKALGCDLVQGYYFSKPVPKEEFDHFIKEAGFERAEYIADSKKNYVSISKALTGEYEGIFYIDVNSDHYILFYTGVNGEFRIHTGGKDFFEDIDEIVPTLAVPEDRERLTKLLGKDELMGWIGADEPFSAQFRRADDGTGAMCTLESIHTRNQDDHHIVIGFRPTADK